MFPLEFRGDVNRQEIVMGLSYSDHPSHWRSLLHSSRADAACPLTRWQHLSV